MAIKLADVVRRNNLAYPVIRADQKNILGYYNGASNSAQQALKLYFNSNVKTRLTSNGNSNTSIQLTETFASAAGSGLVTDTTTRNLLVETGNILIALDEKLLDDSGNIPSSNFPAAYLVNTITTGTVNAAGTVRAGIDRLSELVQQFNRYEPITGLQAGTIDDAAGETFFFAGYDTVNNKMRKISFAELVLGFATEIGNDLIDNGVITVTQSGGNSLVGDLNGDGIITVTDMIAFLGAFGTTGGFDSFMRVLSGSSDEVNLQPVGGYSPSGAGSTAVFSDFDNFNFPSTPTNTTELFGFTTATAASNAENFVKFNNCTVTEQNFSEFFGNKKLRAQCVTDLISIGPDIIAAVVKITLTTGTGDHFLIGFMLPEGPTTTAAAGYAIGYGNSDYPAGVEHEKKWFWSSASVGSICPSFDALNDNNLIAALPWDMSLSEAVLTGATETNPPDRIDDVKAEFAFISMNGFIKVDIKECRLLVDEGFLVDEPLING